MTQAAIPSTPGALADDPRALAFYAPEGPEVFHAVANWNDVWRPDPFDVESIHAEAREVFARLVARASMTPRPTAGRILLLTGESGSGKTHLMRAFRNWAHGERRGYCAYMQMTSVADDYARYILSNLIDSLSQTYFEPDGEATGLRRLSTSLAESPRPIALERLTRLRDDDLDAPCLARIIEALADQIVMDERFDGVDHDLVCALLYLQRDDPRLRGRVLKYLRCEDLSPADREALGGITPRTYPAAAERVVELLGRLMGSIESVPLIVCLDQLESIWNLDESPTRFRRAMGTVCDLAGRVPSSVFVISCLEDFWLKLKDHLATPARARIEQDPRPIRLHAKRNPDEVEQLIAKRLAALYEAQGVAVRPDDPTYPIPDSLRLAQAEQPTRLILDSCRDYHDRCVEAGRLVDGGAVDSGLKPAVNPPDTTRLEQLWNDARSAASAAIPTEDQGLTSLLAWAIAACSDEDGAGRRIAAEVEGSAIRVEVRGHDGPVEHLLVGLCNKSAKGGGLGKQVEEIAKRTGSSTPVIVRSTEFPTSPTAVVSKQIGELISRGGRRVVVEDSDWRAMQSMRAFLKAQEAHPDLAAWRVAETPLSRLESLRRILALDVPRVVPRPTTAPQPLTATTPAPEPPPSPTHSAVAEGGPIAVGTAVGLKADRVAIDPAELAMHAAFLGATGSGKTTVALGIIEQLLLRGIPAILIDRKGDLCRYAAPDVWASPALDAASEARRAAFRDRIDVALYTPGASDGRPLSIAAVPGGLGGMTTDDRETTARLAASALAEMMGYKASSGDQARRVILARAMEQLSLARPDAVVTLPDLINYIDSTDPSLVHAIGKLDPKNFAKLVQDLETTWQSRGNLLKATGEPMEAEALLGLGAHARPGRTRLTIISTKFLGPIEDAQFWVAQFLMEMGRWSSRAPSKSLQAAILFDEADLYLPAVGKPATKEPMENLLKRGRSAGLGLMLASQSPGDFDYKCRENIRSWFVGKITQEPALKKMRPMLSECRIDIESRLPPQTTGQFHLIRDGDARAFRADRSLIETRQIPETEILRLARESRLGS